MTQPGPGEFLAPDGIVIRPIPGATSPLASVVVGIIRPNPEPYAVHRHSSLDQVTYVLSGSVTVISRGATDIEASEITLETGEAVTTPAGTTLSFRNPGSHDAEVLFICTPPYPASNAETELLRGGHAAPSLTQLEQIVERHRSAEEYLVAVLEARAQSFRWLTANRPDANE